MRVVFEEMFSFIIESREEDKIKDQKNIKQIFIMMILISIKFYKNTYKRKNSTNTQF